MRRIMTVNSATTQSNRFLTPTKTTIATLALAIAGAAMADPPTPARNPGVVTFSGQFNSGSQTAGVHIQNVVVNEVEVNSTALGNNLRVVTNDSFLSNGEMQNNTGNQNASVTILGAVTRFNTAEVNATALGNNANYMGIGTEGLGAFTARQQNSGNQGASIVWNEDPSGKVELNATALGNNLSIGRQ